MDKKRRIIHIILAIFVLFLVFLGMFASVDGLLSLITMAEVISFSNSIIIAFFFLPVGFLFLDLFYLFKFNNAYPEIS